ncbi:MAG: TIGR00282 family metallophosphoesterase [Chloroflexi bacterium]|nr:TIGR00282 family metallophosphoesterase [Chloroflexota bacterium]MCZ6708151.1 TIGR00282 family metallophosphoesterase [Chloroflexota bacterium]
MRVLLLGDIMGKAGRGAVAALLPALREEVAADYVVANAENAAAGRGTTAKIAKQLLESGVDVLTGGNHTWAMREFVEVLQGELPALRPANYPAGAPGSGVWSDGRLTVLNLIGRTFMEPLDDPFAVVDGLLESATGGSAIVVDFHAEATSEKQAFGWHLDGRVAAVVGTHTHVPTADARLLPKGTAFVTDLGMCGARDSVIGTEAAAVVAKFRTGLPTRLPPEEKGTAVLNGVLVTIEDATRQALSIERVDRVWEPD